MTDDDRYDKLTGGTHSVIKIIIFSLIAIIIINSFVLPVIASIGEKTETIDNSGVRVSEISELDYEQKMTEIGAGASLALTSNGLVILDTQGTSQSIILVSIEEFDTAYPIAIIQAGADYAYKYNMTVFTYNPDTHRYTYTGYNFSGTTSSYILSYPENGLWIQDPNGKHILTNGSIYTNDLSEITGYGVAYHQKVIYADTDRAYVQTMDIPYGEVSPTVDMDTGGYYTVNSISYQDVECDYYIGPLSASYKTNVLDGTAVGNLINTIPTLMIIGLIVYVVRAVRNDDI